MKKGLKKESFKKGLKKKRKAKKYLLKNLKTSLCS